MSELLKALPQPMFRFAKHFIATLIVVALFELLFFIHRAMEYDLVFDINAVDAITIWATVLTIVFLVFSVLGLMNIDGRIKDLNEQQEELRKLKEQMKDALYSITDSAKEERKKIVEQAEKEILKIVNKSSVRQNLYDRLSKIASTLDPNGRIMLYTEFLQENPDAEGINYAFVYICRGDAYMEMEKYDEALSDYEKAISLTPEDYAPYVSKGIYYVRIKEYAKSIEMFEKASQLNSKLSFIYTNIGNSYSAMNNFDKAKEYYSKAIDLNPDNADYYYNLAKYSHDVKEDETGKIAENYYKYALKLNPHMVMARINLASLYRERNDEATARCVLDDVVGAGINPDYLMAIIQRGICSRMLGDFASAMIDFEHAYFLDPHNVQNLSNLASTNMALQFAHKAHEFARKGLQEAEIQNRHECDADFNEVLRQIHVLTMAANRMTVKLGNITPANSDNAPKQ